MTVMGETDFSKAVFIRNRWPSGETIYSVCNGAPGLLPRTITFIEETVNQAPEAQS
jgi:hypothetical protein